MEEELNRLSPEIQMAIIIERLDNLITLFSKHQEDDEHIQSRVNALERDKAKIYGVIIGANFVGGLIAHYFLGVH